MSLNESFWFLFTKCFNRTSVDFSEPSNPCFPVLAPVKCIEQLAYCQQCLCR